MVTVADQLQVMITIEREVNTQTLHELQSYTDTDTRTGYTIKKSLVQIVQ